MKNRGTSAQLNSSKSSVTQPVGEGRSHRRVEQIEVLHQQFEDLKKKIKDVQSRNQEIIENIHKKYDFKKKQPRTTEYMESKSPIVHYEHGQDKSHISAENQSNNSNQSQCEFKIAKPIVKKVSSIKKNTLPSHHQSVQYRKTEHVSEQREPSQVASNNTNQNLQRKTQTPAQSLGYGTASHFRPMQPISQDPYQITQYTAVPPYQMSMQFPPYPSMAQSFYGTSNSYQYEQAIRRQKEKVRILEKELQEKEADTIALKRLQKRFNNLSVTMGEAVDASLQEFYEEVMKKGFHEIQKHIRKNQNKLRKLHLMLKDREEESRSIKNIAQHRIKRSISRTKKDSPRNNTHSSVPRGPSRKNQSSQLAPHSPAVDNSSASKSKLSDISKSSVKFQQIAAQYQEMIKEKNRALELSQQRYKQKEKELAQVTAKCIKLQLKLVYTEQQSPRKKSAKQQSDREQNLLSSFQLEIQKQSQVKQLSRKVSQFQQVSKKKQLQLKQKDSNLQKLARKLNQFEVKTKRLQNQLNVYKEEKKKSQQDKYKDAQLHLRLRRLQAELQSKENEYSSAKERTTRIQSQKIQRECQNVTLANRIKKLQTLLIVKEQKIQELQKIIQSNAGFELPDLLEKSMTFEKIQQNQMQNLQEQRQRLEQMLNQKTEELFALKKGKQTAQSSCSELLRQNQELKRDIEALLIQNESMKINIKAMQFEKYSVKSERVDSCSPLQKLLEENQCLSEHEDSNIREELEEMRVKYEQAQRIIKAQKHQSLDFNTRIIKINSQLNYYRQLLIERENKYEKIKKEFQQGRYQLTHLAQLKDAQLDQERRNTNQRIMQLQAQILEFQQERFGNKSQIIDSKSQIIDSKSQIIDSNNASQLRNSRNFSEQSFVSYRNTFNNINAQNQLLSEKLKQAQKMIQIQKEMQQKIMEEYRCNIEKIKAQVRQKKKEKEHLAEQSQALLRKVRFLQQNQQRMRQMSRTEDKEQLLGISNERLGQLEAELNQLKQLNSKMTDVEQELLKQLAEKEKDNECLTRLINSKEKKIQQLEDIIELKEMNFSSHISSSQHKSKIKDSQQSQCSLRYSMMSNNINKDRTMELELSQAGQSFYDNNQSMISNVSEVFGREEFPYEKMQLRRVQQRRLFQKTAAYIKSLKHAIDQKNKKIKLLEKKIQSLRNSQLIRKDIYEVKQILDFEPDDQHVFRDYYSVQLQTSHSQRYKLKQLEHETKLTIEENNLLNNQIESLQEELLKSEEQEASLMKLKDLYKDEIKTLIKKNQEQAKVFEDEMKKERQKVEQSESVQRMEALKQLFLKIVHLIALIESEGHKSKKKDERKAQLQEYVKIFCNFLHLEEALREKLLSDLRK